MPQPHSTSKEPRHAYIMRDRDRYGKGKLFCARAHVAHR